MKTNVAESSLAAYDSLGVEPLSRIQSVVMEAIDALGGGWVSRKQIAQQSGLETSTVAGRVNELIAARRLEQSTALMTCPVTGRGVRMVRLR